MTRSASGTREAILGAARSRFATAGYRATTMRAVARDAGIDAALVVRYFGSKQQLFAEAIDVDLQIPDLTGERRSARGARLVDHFLSRWDPATREGEVLLILLRSAATEPAVADTLRELFARQLAPALRPLVDDASELPRRAGLVASQMLGLALTRWILQLPPVAAMTPAELAADVGATIQRYVHSPLPSSRQRG